MTSLKFALCLTCLLLWITASANNIKLSVRQEGGLISANAGDTVTLRCFYEGDVVMFFWYKQTQGQKPKLMSILYKYDQNKITFTDEFKNSSRFSLKTKSGNYHLTISDMRVSDSAIYYCASCSAYNFVFGDGVTVSVKGSGSNVPALVHQSVSGSIQPGDSVTLNCTVQTGTYDEQHSVYWFKDSEEARPGLIYTHGDRKDQCVYNLPLQSLNASHAETYHCGLASCGHILFGNGTKLDFRYADSLVLVYFLGGALVLTTTLTVLLTLLVYRLHKANSCRYTDSQASSTVNAEGDEEADNLHYAALRKQRFSSSEKQKEQSHCVYSTVRQ
ncbi:uncharacterized protein LOC114845356 isoform X2 [Betta splendens]|uniref:Uncharacterized protein LOC114845356 isoform X2 n=1 Tax=Betta splendens TaxID=158456 RepID=A0A6P7L3A9_BETSP|nr:uncharacterized protein LOC114845356 isoform X2 [Betta splendens]